MSEDWSDLWETEHDSITKSLGEIRLALRAIVGRLESIEARLAELEARKCRGTIEGLDGAVTITCPPEWGGGIPLVMIDG